VVPSRRVKSDTLSDVREGKDEEEEGRMVERNI
jgi:hypothetical protein